MSERDSKSAINAHGQQLPNSKSVPALHHVGNSSKFNGNIFIYFFVRLFNSVECIIIIVIVLSRHGQ